MAKPSRSVLFLAPDSGKAQQAAAAFQIASQRLGLSWSVQTRAFAGEFDTISLESASLLVAVDLPDFTPPEVPIRLERMTSAPDLERGVNGLIARLLGGSDAPVSPKPLPSPPPLPKKTHTVKVSRETAGRKGKGVTVVSDLPLDELGLKELATKLKNKCGTGGTAKDGRIEIQGDHRDRLVEELEKLGYKVKRAGG